MDKDSFVERVTACTRLMYHTAWTMLGNEEDCRDAVQEAILRAWEKRHSLRDEACFRPWLMREIGDVAPRMIATLGNVPLRAVTGRALSIGDVHGRVIDAGETGLPLFALYHPASLIYNRSLEPVYEQDVCTLAAWIDRDARGAVLSGAKTDI